MQALNEKVAGIIVTGSPCGFGYSPAYWAAPGTPILVIAGTKDPYVHKARNAKELTAFCTTVRGVGKLKAVSVTGMGHFAAIWWPGVRDAVGALLDSEPIAVSRRKVDDVDFPRLSPAELEEYRALASPKALAADGKGNFSWSAGAETKLDAEEMALFDCDERTGFDPFTDASHQHACAVVDMNGKRVVK